MEISRRRINVVRFAIHQPPEARQIRVMLDNNFRKADARAFSLSSPKGGEGRGEEAVF